MSTKMIPKFNLETPIEQLAGVGPAYAKRLEKLGIATVRDLLTHYPRRYEDFSKIATIAEARAGETVSIRGRLLEIVAQRSPRKRMMVTQAMVADETGAVRVAWFNQPYLAKTLKVGDELILSGKIEHRYGGFQMTSPEYEPLKREQAHTAGIIPVYPETEGLSSKWLRSRVKPLLRLADELADTLPEETRNRRQLLPLTQAIREVHFPTDQTSLARARRRLSFEELLLFQLLTGRIKRDNQSLQAPVVPFDQERARAFVASLPFLLTQAQRRASWEILQDLSKAVPMNRLLEGDVGSGKTVVAAMALHHVHGAGFQGALMAPTEILAGQHYARLREILAPFGIRVALLTRSRSELDGVVLKRNELLAVLASGEVPVVVGTHALLSPEVSFHKLALAVVDEQHRFGVAQRAALRQENGGLMPHLLSMTATPIPRTLALTVYGDLDLSVLDELPPGRTPVETRRVMPHERREAYEFIRGKVREGRQAFVIYPVIDESEALGVRGATAEYERLRKDVFPEFRLGLLHGRLKSAEKEAAMQAFARGEIQILVATSVVEVGVDVPNATVVVIEGAERFGLAQLHQMRGRVGRGIEQSYCLLFSDSDSEEAAERLELVARVNDGFELAEADLRLRGPGEIYGRRQSGLPELQVADLFDHALIREAREEAEHLLGRDPSLAKYPMIRERLEQLLVTTHLE